MNDTGDGAPAARLSRLNSSYTVSFLRLDWYHLYGSQRSD
jgi:hypothetical protein